MSACVRARTVTSALLSARDYVRTHSATFTPLCSRPPHQLVASAVTPKPLVRAEMHDVSRRRIAAVARHLLPNDAAIVQSGLHSSPALQSQNTAAEESSYAKVHGAVSRKTAKWTQIPTVQRHDLSEVIYEKAREEGIAKVSCWCCPPCQACHSHAQRAWQTS